MKKIINKCNIYTALWSLYYLQGTFYEKGSFLSRILLLLLLLWSLYIFIKVIKRKLPSLLSKARYFMYLGVIYGIIIIVSGVVVYTHGVVIDKTSFSKTFLVSFLPLFSYFYFSMKGYISEKWFFGWFFIFLCTATLSYYGEQRAFLALELSSREEFTNNAGYRFLALLPLAVFLKKSPILQFVSIGYIMVFLLMGMKRGAILIGVVCFIWMIRPLIENATTKKKYIFIGFSIALILYAISFFQQMLQTSDYFKYRYEETLSGNTSGREEIYVYFWDVLINSDLFNLIFGHGAYATVRMLDMYAHNDWLEIAVDMGLLGVTIYFVYWFYYYKTWKSLKFDNMLYMSMGLCLISTFLKSLVSMSYSQLTVYTTTIMGYCIYKAYEKANRKS